MGHVGGRAELVADDPHLAAVGEGAHREREVAAEGAVEPGGTHDLVSRVLGAHRLLARQLAAAVGGEGMGRVELVVGASSAAVEHVVGRDVHHAQTALGGRQRQVARADCVSREGTLRVALGAVDGVVGGGVHHQVRLDARHLGADRGQVGDVELRVAARHDLVARPPAGDGTAELAAGAGEQHLHASKSS